MSSFEPLSVSNVPSFPGLFLPHNVGEVNSPSHTILGERGRKRPGNEATSNLLFRLEQVNNVCKYEKIWAVYEAKYNSMEKVQQMKQKREELQGLSEKSEI